MTWFIFKAHPVLLQPSKYPTLAGLSNRVVHRAELIVEQVYDISDTIFPPTNLYLDAYDPIGLRLFRDNPIRCYL